MANRSVDANVSDLDILPAPLCNTGGGRISQILIFYLFRSGNKPNTKNIPNIIPNMMYQLEGTMQSNNTPAITAPTSENNMVTTTATIIANTIISLIFSLYKESQLLY